MYQLWNRHLVYDANLQLIFTNIDMSPGADPEGVAGGGANGGAVGAEVGASLVERHRREDRGAEGTEGWGFSIFELKKASLGAFWDW